MVLARGNTCWFVCDAVDEVVTLNGNGMDKSGGKRGKNAKKQANIGCCIYSRHRILNRKDGS